MVKKILGGIVAIILILVVVIATRPTDYRVERSLTMKAPASVAFSIVSDFNTFEQWSPWAHLDPAMKKEIKGAGQGSTYYWNGNDDVGEGRMTITSVEEPNKVSMDLEFIRPFPGKAETGFVVAEEGENVKVTWWMNGHNGFMEKAVGLFMSFEDMIGKDYDKGLAALKPIVEAKAEEAAKAAMAAAPAEGEAAAPAEGEAVDPKAEEAKEATP
jgi:hypothetical protein